MTALRSLAGAYRHLALLVAVLALAVKALVPAGYMVSAPGRTLTITLCADASGQMLTHTVELPGKPAPTDKTPTCAFAALGFAALGGADPVLLAAALVFILLVAFTAAAPPLVAAAGHLRPPLRGPPAIA